MKTADPKISACVDCATPIIGDRLRCPACHDRYAAEFLAGMSGDDDATLPRDRSRRGYPAWKALGIQIGAVFVCTAVVFLMILGRGC